jgi:hypothetical protein
MQVYLNGSVTAIQDLLKPNRDIYPPVLYFNSASYPDLPINEIENASEELGLAQPKLDNHQVRFKRLIGGDQLIIRRDNRRIVDDELGGREVQDLDQLAQQALDPYSGVSAQEALEDARVLSRKILRHATAVMETSREATEPPENPKILSFKEAPSSEDGSVSNQEDRTRKPFTVHEEIKTINYENEFGDRITIPYVNDESLAVSSLALIYLIIY